MDRWECSRNLEEQLAWIATTLPGPMEEQPVQLDRGVWRIKHDCRRRRYSLY